jgi:phosphatidylserine decarboxylase
MLGAVGKLLIAFLRLLPRNGLSRIAGWIASRRLPQPLQRWVILAFGRSVGVDFAEVRDPLESFDSLQAFFGRALREGVRPIDPAPDAFVAPCDATWGEAGGVKDGLALQLKGRPYSVAELLGGDEEARRFEGGAFATFYLSPRDYHRFHAPCAVRVAKLRYLPGSLWPVNRAGVEGIEGLFARNERICAWMDPIEAGQPGQLCLVAVGATLVGKVRLRFDDLCTNRYGARGETRTYSEEAPRLEKGQEWGRFEFGSTIVALATPGLLSLPPREVGERLVLGRRIGTLLAPEPG